MTPVVPGKYSVHPARATYYAKLLFDYILINYANIFGARIDDDLFALNAVTERFWFQKYTSCQLSVYEARI